MLTSEQKRLIEQQAQTMIRREWGNLNGVRVRGIIDDLRARLVEQPWFGETMEHRLNDARYLANEPDKADLGRLYEWGTEKMDGAREAVFGKDAPERKAPERNEPEVER